MFNAIKDACERALKEETGELVLSQSELFDFFRSLESSSGFCNAYRCQLSFSHMSEPSARMRLNSPEDNNWRAAVIKGGYGPDDATITMTGYSGEFDLPLRGVINAAIFLARDHQHIDLHVNLSGGYLVTFYFSPWEVEYVNQYWELFPVSL